MEERRLEKRELLPEVIRLSGEGATLGAISCLDMGDYFELIYHFKKGLDIVNLRFSVKKGESVPSITSVLLGAVLIPEYPAPTIA